MEATRPLLESEDRRPRPVSPSLPETVVPEDDGTCCLAVLLPCHNEERAIAAVVHGFRASLPNATIYVYDNGSTDATAEVAKSASAIVRREPMLGKGNVVRRMFADVDADVYVLVDGDDTYDARAASLMVELLLRERLDMVLGHARPSPPTQRYTGRAIRPATSCSADCCKPCSVGASATSSPGTG